MKVYALTVAILVSFLMLGSVNAAELKVQSEGMLAGKPVFIDGTHYGFVGDTINIVGQKLRLRIPGEKHYSFEIQMDITEDTVSILNQRASAANCKPQRKIRWQPSTVSPIETSENAWVVTISAPEIGKKTGKKSCISALLGGCKHRKTTLIANSLPTGAEVWIDNKKVGVTDGTFSVPFCKGERFESVALRMTNKVNCVQKIALKHNQNVNLSCALQDVQ